MPLLIKLVQIRINLSILKIFLKNLIFPPPRAGLAVKRISLQQRYAYLERRQNSAWNPNRGLGRSAHSATGLYAPGGGMG